MSYGGSCSQGAGCRLIKQQNFSWKQMVHFFLLSMRNVFEVVRAVLCVRGNSWRLPDFDASFLSPSKLCPCCQTSLWWMNKLLDAGLGIHRDAGCLQLSSDRQFALLGRHFWIRLDTVSTRHGCNLNNLIPYAPCGEWQASRFLAFCDCHHVRADSNLASFP